MDCYSSGEDMNRGGIVRFECRRFRRLENIVVRLFVFAFGPGMCVSTAVNYVVESIVTTKMRSRPSLSALIFGFASLRKDAVRTVGRALPRSADEMFLG